LSDLPEKWAIYLNADQSPLRLCYFFPQPLLIGLYLTKKKLRVSLKQLSAVHNLCALLQIIFGFHFHMQTKAILELRSQLSFFWIS
jgi:hypothetical protein